VVAADGTELPSEDDLPGGASWSAPGSTATQPRLLAVLQAAGYPSELLDPLDGTALFPICVEDAFAILGPPPRLPRALGALVAVVAPVGEALPLARSLAAAHRIEASAVALVTSPKSPTVAAPARPGDGLVATDLPAIRALSPGWRRDRVGIVAVELDDRRATTRAALRELTPSAVWMAADARHKCEDLSAAVDAIGGADALMVLNASATTTPAALLRTGIPIATLDGRRADPSRWARIVRDADGEA